MEAYLGEGIVPSKDMFISQLPKSVTLFENSGFAHVAKFR